MNNENLILRIEGTWRYITTGAGLSSNAAEEKCFALGMAIDLLKQPCLPLRKKSA